MINLITTHPASVQTLTWETDQGNLESVTGTAEHPFWVDGKAAFVPMGELECGDELVVAGGGCARVVSLTAPRGPPADSTEPFTTYNIEVGDAHTYFVGQAGVWVHNAGTECERILSVFEWELKRDPVIAGNPMEAYLRTRAKLPKMTEKTEAGFVQGVLDEIKMANTNGTLEARWRAMGIDSEIGGGFREREVFAGYRYEIKTGKTLRRSTVPGVDFEDVASGQKWDVKGPIHEQSDIQDILNRISDHINRHPLGDKKLIVDTAGMNALQKSRVASQLSNYDGNYYLLEGTP